jgi:hypothetical protein
MSALRRNNRSFLSWALLCLAALAVALAVVHFRERLTTSASDQGGDGESKVRSQNDATPIVSASGQLMTLDPTGRFLINSTTHKPVFITGEAAWSLITQLNDADVEIYLSDRAARKFNYIWCAAADNYFQSHAPNNAYGDRPFDGADFTHENAKYWAHVDSVIARAAFYGITVALDPGFVGLSSPAGYLASYQNSPDAVLTAYGEFLGDRYNKSPNLIWALGGDVDPGSGVVPKLTALANGIRSKDKVHLIVAEGQPQFAALDTFANTNWMNLNWLYFHTTIIPRGAASNYSRSPWLPPFQGESWYENESYANRGSVTELELRQQGYNAVLSGAYLGNGGFGNNPVWYFNGGPSAKAGEPAWKTQLGSQGSIAQELLGRLFRSREHWKLVPDTDHKIMTAGYDSRSSSNSVREFLRSLIRRQPYREGCNSAVAARTSDGQTIIAYIPTGNATTIAIDLSEIKDAGSHAQCWWFNPRDGSATLIGSFAASGTRKFTAPDGDDWVLVVDGLGANLAAPATVDL